jgi:hypothetical protein
MNCIFYILLQGRLNQSSDSLFIQSLAAFIVILPLSASSVSIILGRLDSFKYYENFLHHKIALNFMLYGFIGLAIWTFLIVYINVSELA